MAAPIKKLSARGISLAVWENETSEGRKTHSVTFEKRYKDKESDEWKSSSSYFLEDLPRLIALLQKVYSDMIVKERDSPSHSSDDEVTILE